MKHFPKSIGQYLMTVLMTSTILEAYTLPLFGASSPPVSPSPDAPPQPSTASANTEAPSIEAISETMGSAPLAGDPLATDPAAQQIQPEVIPSASNEISGTAGTREAGTPATVPSAAPHPAQSAPPAADAHSNPEAAGTLAAKLTAARQEVSARLAALVNRDRLAKESQLQQNLAALALYYAQIGELDDARQVARHPALSLDVQTALLAEIDQFEVAGQPATAQTAAAPAASDPEPPATAAPSPEPVATMSIAGSAPTAEYWTVPVTPELIQPYLSDRCLNPTPQPVAAAKPVRSSSFLPIGQQVAAQLMPTALAKAAATAKPTAKSTQPPIQISQTVTVSRVAAVSKIELRSQQPNIPSASPPIATIAPAELAVPAIVSVQPEQSTVVSSPAAQSIRSAQPVENSDSAAIKPSSAAMPKTLQSLFEDWLYGTSPTPSKFSRGSVGEPYSAESTASTAKLRESLQSPTMAEPSAEAPEISVLPSVLPEDSYTFQQPSPSISLPQLIKLSRRAAKTSALPPRSLSSQATVKKASSLTSNDWQTIAANCGGVSQSATNDPLDAAWGKRLTGSGMIFPLPIPVALTSGFGWRVHPITGDRRFHTGIDLGAPLGTPVLSTLAGRVVSAGDMGGYGLAVIVESNLAQQQNLYAHLSAIAVRPGDQVAQGSVLGLVGSTGSSTGPHLHFETLLPSTEGWSAVNPLAAATASAAQMP